MTKRFKKIVYTSFLLVFLLGYIGTIVPGSVIASLFDLEVRALDGDPEEPEKLSSLNLVNEAITPTINSNSIIPDEWTNGDLFSDDYIMCNGINWLDGPGDEAQQLNYNEFLNDYEFIYGLLDLSPQDEYEFDEGLTISNVKVNNGSITVVDVSVEGPTYMTVTIKIEVVSSNEARKINPLRIGSAALNPSANTAPEFYARSLEQNDYSVYEERFDEVGTSNYTTSNNVNPNFIFEGNKTYSYTIWIKPVDASVAYINAATTIEINNVEYTITSSDINGDDIVFHGVPNIVVAGAIVPTTYTLTFETKGGSPLAPLTNINENTVINLSSYNPTRQNYDFDGWYSDPELQNRVTSVTMTDNITVYAKWTLNYGDISLTYINPTGLSAFKINDTNVTGNTITGYITSNYKNTFKIVPNDSWTVTSVVVTDASDNVTNAGPGTVNEYLEFQVNGTTSYDVVITLTEEAFFITTV